MVRSGVDVVILDGGDECIRGGGGRMECCLHWQCGTASILIQSI